MDQWCGERLSQESKTYKICKSKIWRPTARKATLQVSPILDIWMSQKVESLVVCGWIENSNHNNGQYRRTTTAGIHQRIPRESIASPKETMRWDGSTALFQCVEAPGRLKILGYSYYDIDHELNDDKMCWSQPDSDTDWCKCEISMHQTPNTCSQTKIYISQIPIVGIQSVLPGTQSSASHELVFSLRCS